MRCEDAREIFDLYFKGRLTEKEMKELQEHMNVCQGCSAEYKGYEETLIELSAYRIPDPGEEYWDAALAKTLEKAAGMERRYEKPGIFAALLSLLSPRRLAYSLGLILILIAGITTFIEFRQDRLTQQDELALEMAADINFYDEFVIEEELDDDGEAEVAVLSTFIDPENRGSDESSLYIDLAWSGIAADIEIAEELGDLDRVEFDRLVAMLKKSKDKEVL